MNTQNTKKPAEMDELEYLLASPENAKRLRRSIEQLESGNGHEHELIEVE